MASKPLFSSFSRISGFLDRTGIILESRKFKFYPSVAGSVLFLALSLFLLLMMPGQVKIREDQLITARTFPSILAYIMMGCAILNLIKDGIKLIRGEIVPFTEILLYNEVRALLLLLFLVIFAVLMPLVGFIAASVIYGILMLFYFRVKNWKYYAIVCFLAVLIGLLFKYVLHVRLP